MNFNPMDQLQNVKGRVLDIGAEQSSKLVSQANQLLKLLQDAGYQIGELNVELGVPPTVTVELKTGPLVKDSKLEGIFLANKNNDALALILNLLIQANKVRDMVNVETIELKSTTLVLKTPPSISLQWKEKAAANAAGASA
jgi:hypothetical protein